ncbi:MAG TPA: helix-turn-helix domain-containing protein [Bacteroidales bacterium]|nr:helix-turn-helix domain-containing protein [Bacteroidales bacterium]HQN15775.1 helix-turn-helix domain-containing protein [Bacteroidales bacterium]HQP15199.1 helix-turn-helix domain-containing protein [Bacteroidales bacterium]
MSSKPKFSEEHKQIALIAKALSHPARVYIMEKLSCMSTCCTSGEMIGDIPIARSTLSQHLKELKLAGLIQGNIEPPQIKYCINQQNWNDAKKLLTSFLKKNTSSNKESC